MSVAIAARFARRELRGGLKGFTIFLSCLALGVAAIAAVGSVRTAIETGLASEGAALLGGDAELDFTFRMASDDEKAWMQSNATTVSEIVDFRSMAVVDTAGQAERGLTQVKAVDEAYPLIGTVGLTPEMDLDAALAQKDGLPGAVMERALIDRLGLSIGDSFALGTQQFHLAAELTREPDGAAGGFGLGPRTIVRTTDLANSSLLASGTLFNSKYRLDLPENPDLAALETEAQDKFQNSGMRWTDARNGAPGIARFVERLGAFLVLVGLSGLAVGGVGVSTAVRAYLATKTETIATLRTLGAERRVIFLTYFLQIGVLSLCGIALGLVLGGVGPLLLGPLIAAQLPFPAVFSVYPGALAESALYGVLTALLFTLWPLARAERIRAAALYRDAVGGPMQWPAKRYILATLATLGFLIAAAALFSGAPALALWTAGGLIGALIVLLIAGAAIGWLARISNRLARGKPALRWALASIASTRDGAMPAVLALGLDLETLPDRWYGLSLLSTLVWGPNDSGDPSSTAMSETTRHAVREWVFRGGHLVVVLPDVSIKLNPSTMSNVSILLAKKIQSPLTLLMLISQSLVTRNSLQ